MNISQVSFGSENRERNYRSDRYRNAASSQQTHSTRTTSQQRTTTGATNPSAHRNRVRENSGMNRAYSDTFESKAQNNSSQSSMSKPVKAGLAGLAALALALTVRNCTIDKVLDVQAQQGETVQYFAEIYDSDVDVLMDYNRLKSDEIPYDMEISIPPKFDVLDGKVEELQEQLYDKGLSVEERNELEDEIENIQDLEELQSKIAKAYTDGKFVYYLMLDTVNAETFKDVFGIKDGVIRKHNQLSYTWGNNEYGGYRDYTGSSLSEGETIKVPVRAVDEKYIERLKDK